MAKLNIREIGYDQAPDLFQFEDHSIGQTIEWLRFIAQSQNGRIIIGVVEDGNRPVGRFSGIIIKKYGLQILGSPFPGWTTQYMGFNLDPSISRLDALIALKEFAFRKLGCVHIEIMDKLMTTEEYEKAGFKCMQGRSFEIDLTQTEEQLLAAMKPEARKGIRRANKNGVIIEVASDISFADEYYSQLLDVFAKQGLVPTYPIERVRNLIEHLLPTGRLLLARAKDSTNNCIATGIIHAMNGIATFWGTASWRSYQHLHPNEALYWFAMCYWKERGMVKCDLGGGGEYKVKYGGREVKVFGARRSKYPGFDTMRNLGKFLFNLKRRAKDHRKQEVS